MYKPEEVADCIKRTAKSSGFQVLRMLDDLDLTKNTLSNMYKGSMIKADSLARIADYLGCSVDFLLGRVVQTSPESSRLTDEEYKLIALFRHLNEEGQEKLLDNADDLFVSGKYKKCAENIVVAEEA